MNEIRKRSVSRRHNNNNNNNNNIYISNKLQFTNINNKNNNNCDQDDSNNCNNNKHKQIKQIKEQQTRQQQEILHIFISYNVTMYVSSCNSCNRCNFNCNENNCNYVCNASDVGDGIVRVHYYSRRLNNSRFITQLIILKMVLMLMLLITRSCLANKPNELFTNSFVQQTENPINVPLHHNHHYKHHYDQQYDDQSKKVQEIILPPTQQSTINKNRELEKLSFSTPMLTTLTDLERQVVERLIRQWSPIVWLAPHEKFMPLGVEEFLAHVHPETKSKRMDAGIDMPIGDITEKAYLVTNTDIEELLEDNTSFIYGRNPNLSTVPIYAVVTICPTTATSTIASPSLSTIMTTTTTTTTTKTIDNQLFKAPQTTVTPLTAFPAIKNPNLATSSYIPIPLDGNEIEKLSNNLSTIRRSSRLYPMFNKKRTKRQVPIKNDMLNAYNLVMGEAIIQSRKANVTNNEILFTSIKKEDGKEVEKTTTDKNVATFVNNFIANLADNVKFSQPMTNINETFPFLNYKQQFNNISQGLNSTVTPVFHVTYWMFYPYSQGKNMCTLNLGPFGSIPFPTVYGYCLGSHKDIGSHIGDWEHMSLYFNGATEPESMYVSAHDAGAYYLYNRLTGSFEFKKQETRKGILQRPNFPKTVTTFDDHPVLFAAKGSHGLWTAPGKHPFVKVARLYDINGFGTPWNTWKNVEISYNNLQKYGRSLIPSWLHFKGKWGNPKSKCHPFRLIGLNFCEFSDGPTGIPLKKPHFQC